MNALAIGDSWLKVVAGGGTPWPDQIGAINQGISGSTAAEWAADKDGRLTKAKQTEADTVIVSLMGNDLLRAMQDGKLTVAEMVGAFISYRTVLSTFKSSRVVCLLYACPFREKEVKKLNRIIKWACLGSGALLLDCHSFLGSHHFERPDIHPNQAGHDLIAIKAQETIGGAQ